MIEKEARWTWMTIVFFAFLSLFFVFNAPPSHNPDGNYYYGVALRLSNGDFLRSIDGLYSPLLSWFMAPVIASGASVPFSFRIVNLCAFLAVLWYSSRIGRELTDRVWLVQLSVILLGVHLSYFTVFLITSDLFTAAVYSGFCYYLLKASEGNWQTCAYKIGIFGGLSYLAKAIQLPILLLTLGLLLFFPFVRSGSTRGDRTFFGLKLLLALFVVALPWVGALSYKHGQPVISSQQFIYLQKIRLEEYHPDFNYKPPVEITATSSSSIATSGTPARSGIMSVVQKRANRIWSSLVYLTNTTAALLFGYFSWFFYLCVVFLGGFWMLYAGSSKQKILSLVFFTHVGVYAFMWGPYIRYYFPVLGLGHLIFFLTIVALYERVSNIFSSVRAIRLSLVSVPLLAVLLMVLTTIRSVRADWFSRTDKVVEFALALPEMKGQTGALTSNWQSPYPGIIAYQAKREHWSALDLRGSPGQEKWLKRLNDWGINQVLWFGDLPVELKDLPSFDITGPYTVEKETFYVLTRIS